jgi:hypothetical protein
MGELIVVTFFDKKENVPVNVGVLDARLSELVGVPRHPTDWTKISDDAPEGDGFMVDWYNTFGYMLSSGMTFARIRKLDAWTERGKKILDYLENTYNIEVKEFFGRQN